MPISNRSFSCFSHTPFIQHVVFISSRHYASRFLPARSWLLFSESFSFPLGNLKNKKKKKKACYSFAASKHIFQQSKGRFLPELISNSVPDMLQDPLSKIAEHFALKPWLEMLMNPCKQVETHIRSSMILWILEDQEKYFRSL